MRTAQRSQTIPFMVPNPDIARLQNGTKMQLHFRFPVTSSSSYLDSSFCVCSLFPLLFNESIYLKHRHILEKKEWLKKITLTWTTRCEFPRHCCCHFHRDISAQPNRPFPSHASPVGPPARTFLQIEKEDTHCSMRWKYWSSSGRKFLAKTWSLKVLLKFSHNFLWLLKL